MGNCYFMPLFTHQKHGTIKKCILPNSTTAGTATNNMSAMNRRDKIVRSMMEDQLRKRKKVNGASRQFQSVGSSRTNFLNVFEGKLEGTEHQNKHVLTTPKNEIT